MSELIRLVPAQSEGDPAQQADFAIRKTGYFVALAHRYSDLLQLHKEPGQLHRSSEEFGYEEQPRKFDNKTIPKRWGDPTQHCLVEAAAIGALSEMLALPAEDKDLLMSAAIIHDYRKKGEIEETKAVQDSSAVDAAYQKSKDGLRTQNVDERLIALTEAVAHSSLPEFAEIEESTGDIVLRDEIPLTHLVMHYGDDIIHGTEIVELRKRMQGLVDRQHLYPYNEDGKKLWGGRTYFEAQLQVAILVEKRLADLLGVPDPVTLPRLINERVRENISNFGKAT